MLDDPLPDIRQFDCKRLKNYTMTDECYAGIKQMWIDNKWTKMLDMLRWYNCLDTSAFLLGLDEMVKFWRGFKLDALKSECY